ncbi:MAG: hypothetical protein OXN25_10830 [Candidatus Poribacteria bacterium]|nr:hypothetical protein [Candidatus Poribacteria bacterium]
MLERTSQRSINTAIEEKGLQATLKELQQGAYDLETEVIKQTEIVQTQAERVNEKLAAWEKALPEGEKPIFDDEEVEPIDVASKFPDHTREIDPPSQSEASTETQACRGCMESLQPPYDDTTIIPPDPISQQAVKINKKVYRDHGVVCAETRHSTGKTCEGGLYFTCPNPNAGTVTACRHAADHRIVGPCPEGEEKHT